MSGLQLAASPLSHLLQASQGSPAPSSQEMTLRLFSGVQRLVVLGISVEEYCRFKVELEKFLRICPVATAYLGAAKQI